MVTGPEFISSGLHGPTETGPGPGPSPLDLLHLLLFASALRATRRADAPQNDLQKSIRRPAYNCFRIRFLGV